MGYTDATNVHYDDAIDDWTLIHRMHSGEGAWKELMRGTYEASRAFEKRKKLADWRPYTRDLISRLTGELFSHQGEVSRDTAASEEYLASVGPGGESYQVQLIAFVEALVAYHETWLVMDPAQGLRVLEPFRVPRWTPETVTVKGVRVPPSAPDVSQKRQEAWTVYFADHYETYVQVQDDSKEIEERLVDEGRYAQDFAFSSGPPAARVTLPWTVRFGLAVAEAHRSLYRLESKYDAALTNSLGGLLQIATGGDDTIKNQIEKALKKGSIAVPYDAEYGEHKPVNIGVEGLPHGKEQLQRKREELYRTAYQSLDQAATQMSATEARQRGRSGPAAALSVLAETVQSAEEFILPVIAEAEDRRNATRETTAKVSWPADFADEFDSADEQLAQDIFGSLRLPVPTETATDVVMARLESAGHDPDREAVQSEVESKMGQQARNRSASGFGIGDGQ